LFCISIPENNSESKPKSSARESCPQVENVVYNAHGQRIHGGSMEEDKPSILRTIYEEFRAGNPLIILMVLFVLVLAGSLWVWQTTYYPVVNTPTPRYTHSGAESPVKALTARALTGIPPQVTPTATVVATPKAAIPVKERAMAVPFFFGGRSQASFTQTHFFSR
jgi:hypothetical protein